MTPEERRRATAYLRDEATTWATMADTAEANLSSAMAGMVATVNRQRAAILRAAADLIDPDRGETFSIGSGEGP